LLLLGVATVLTLLAAWFLRPALNKLLNPLPQKRFVALLAWPAVSSPEHGALLKGVLDNVAGRLSRAENSTRELLIISPRDVTGTSITPADTVGALGANLVLAASARETTDGVALDLAVLDSATWIGRRKSQIVVAASELSRLPDRASIAAANLLDIRLSNAQPKDHDDLASVAPSAYPFFARAEELAALPNESGTDQAIEQYQKALDADPRFALAYAHLSIAYTRKFRVFRDSAALSLASRNADLAIRYNPASAQSLLSRAMVDLESGRSKEALDGLNEALRQDPGNPQILSNKARLLRDLDRRGEEEKLYREIIADRPNYWPAYNLLGQNLYMQGRYSEASEAFAEGSAIAPRIALLFTNRGAAELALNHTAEAEQAFRNSLERAPTETAYGNLGTIAFGNKDYRKALDYYQKARDLNPRNDGIWRNLGDTYAMLGDEANVKESYGRAASLLSAAMRTNPSRGAAWMTLAFYEAKVGRRVEAEKALASAEQRGATDLSSLLKKAQVYALLGEKEKAIELVLHCLMRGLSRADVELSVDLKDVRRDPRYLRAIETRKP